MSFIHKHNNVDTNERLLQGYADGNAHDFSTFYRKNSSLIYHYILSRTNNRPDADDILQETFFRIHRYIHRFDPSQSALGWTFQIARNVIIDQFHKKKSHDFESSPSDQSKELNTPLESSSSNMSDPKTAQIQHDSQVNRMIAQEELKTIIGNLSPSERRLLLERFVEHESYEELASKLKTTPANVRQRLSRMLRRIKLSRI